MFDGFVVDLESNLFISGVITGTAFSFFTSSIVFFTWWVASWRPIKRKKYARKGIYK